MQKLSLLAFSIALLCSASSLHAQTNPEVQLKANAPGSLQKVFETQDDTRSRTKNRGIRLQRRGLEASPGIAAELTRRRAKDESPVMLIASLDRFPALDEWQEWAVRGIEHVQYLGNRHWLLKVEKDLPGAFATTKAFSFTEFLDTDKMAPELDQFVSRPDFFDRDKGLVVVDLTLMPKQESAAQELREKFHSLAALDIDKWVDNSGGRILTLVTEPSNLARLAEQTTVLGIAPGAWTNEELMDGVRALLSH